MTIETTPRFIPPCAIPSIPWVKLWIDGHEVSTEMHYQKQSLRNRYSILGVNGPIWLTIPVESTQGIRTPIKEIRIARNEWRRVHWRTLLSAYARAAFWEHYSSALQRIFYNEHTFLIDVHFEMTEWILSSGITPKPIHERQKTQEVLHSEAWEPHHKWPLQNEYPQVFSDRHPFQHNLSIIDLVMNLGPKSNLYMHQVSIQSKS